MDSSYLFLLINTILNLHLFIIASGSGSNRTDRISLINFDFFLVLKTIRSVCFIALYSVDHQLDMQLWFIFIYLGLNLSNRQRYSKKNENLKNKNTIIMIIIINLLFFSLIASSIFSLSFSLSIVRTP